MTLEDLATILEKHRKWWNDEEGGERADLQGANLQGANLQGANLDFAAWPLWCGSLGATVDARIAAQIAYHFCRLDCTDPDFQEARSTLAPFANQFRRVEECSPIHTGTVPDADPTVEIRGPEVWAILRRRDGELTDIRAVAISTVGEYEDMLAANADAMEGEDGPIAQESIFLTGCRDRGRAEDWAALINSRAPGALVGIGGGGAL